MSINRSYKKNRKIKKEFSISLKNNTSTTLTRPSKTPTLSSDKRIMPDDIYIRWLAGEWHEIEKNELSYLIKNAETHELDLIIASAFFQTGDIPKAKLKLIQSKKSGTKIESIKKILISGIHYNLGKINSILEKKDHAKKHFCESIKIVTGIENTHPWSEIREGSLLQKEIANPPKIEIFLETENTKENQNNLTLLQKENEKISEIYNLIKKQDSEIAKLKIHLEKTLKKEVSNASQQIEAFLNIQSFFNNKKVLPSMHGFPISPDFALYLIEKIKEEKYDLIIETGSGASTILISELLKETKQDLRTTHVALEHLEQYYKKTLSELKSKNLEKSQLFLTPLEKQNVHGNEYPYYDCESVLRETKEKIEGNPKILVIVDGPPASTGIHARYPIWPIVHNIFSNSEIDIILDDASRDDEKEIITMWKSDMEAFGIIINNESFVPLERGAHFISTSTLKNVH